MLYYPLQGLRYARAWAAEPKSGLRKSGAGAGLWQARLRTGTDDSRATSVPERPIASG
jgi:hypothetical protein